MYKFVASGKQFRENRNPLLPYRKGFFDDLNSFLSLKLVALLQLSGQRCYGRPA
jgi:hypothetical protein